MKNLENKVAIVTGGGSGIGRAISLLYALEGAKIIVSDVDEKGGKSWVTIADVFQSNGVIHVVNTVLMPK